MNTASILIKTDPDLKAKAQKTAKNMGLSLSVVINRYLKHFIETKKLTFIADEDETPNAKTARELKLSEDDVKAGRVISFDNPKDVHSYLDMLVKDAKRK